jgi:UDP-N-acetylglucosamine--N-acetylmuramyl-(pentapeptide) pyrophosphoryl-undecaprenol N-acetylglucosamine transferase
MMALRPVLIMAGGTGGHVFPALAVADELRTRGIPVVWLGTQAGIEARLVPQAGYPIEWLSIKGLRGKNRLSQLLIPLRLVLACTQAASILRRRNPCAVLGMGGFASGPGGFMAWLMRRPLLIHEQNAVAGLTNRLLAKLTRNRLEAFPGALGKHAEHIGNPVRRDIIAITAPEQRLATRTAAMRVLVVGGSLGAVRLNQIIPEALAKMRVDIRPEVHHQTGRNNLEAAREAYRKHGVEARVDAFIDDMAAAYAWADLVVCRAGAMTVFELAAAGVASILIPYPYAVDDHQTANAAYLVAQGAALMRQQNELNSDWLCEQLTQFSEHRERLTMMACAARAQAKPEAARVVADRCMAAGGLK